MFKTHNSCSNDLYKFYLKGLDFSSGFLQMSFSQKYILKNLSIAMAETAHGVSEKSVLYPTKSLLTHQS